MLTFNQKLKLCGFATGILFFFSVAGLSQEKIFRHRYGNEIDPIDKEIGEKFRMPMTFGLIEAAIHTLIAKGKKFIA